MIYEPVPFGRICRKCKLWKPRAELRKHSAHPSGVDAFCRQCHRAEAKQRFRENRQEILDKERQRRKENPEPYREYDKKRRLDPQRRQYNIEYSKKYHIENKAKANARSKRYAQEHPEVMRRSVKNWTTKNPGKAREIRRAAQQRRKARKAGLVSSFTKHHWELCLRWWGGRCAVCGRPAGFWHTLAQDHWIPVKRGGNYTPDNILPLCHGVGGCNNSKESRDPVEWLVKRFGERKAKKILKRIQDYFEWINLQP